MQMKVQENMIEDDEDVVLQGSFLDKHLRKMGCGDFESVVLHDVSPSKTKDIYQYLGITKVLYNFHKRINNLYSWILQEVRFSKEQMGTILQVEALLSDHALAIQNFIDKNEEDSNMTMIGRLLLASSAGFISFGIVYFYCKHFFTYIFTSSTLCLFSQLKYTRLCAIWDLQCLISLQNELHILSKKGLKILRRRYKIKQDPTKATPHFQVYARSSLKHIQPITECVIKYLENMSFVYYNVSAILSKLLPSSITDQYTTTKFDNESLKLHGEISYQSLKHLYHTYILVQSEMLLLLCVAYDRDTWINVHKSIPEIQLAHIVKLLVQALIKHKQKLSEVIEAFYNCEVDVVRYKYTGSTGSNLQNLYIHLDLTSHKLQLAQKYITSILNDIDNYEENIESNHNLMEKIIHKANDMYMQVINAKTFAEYSNLLATKTVSTQQKKFTLNNATCNSDHKLVTITDPEPILDEVFEEYIKEEYLKSLRYDASYDLEMDDQLDNLVRNNFMSELKEVLVDKQKIMSEREAKALQRMNKFVPKDLPSVVHNDGDDQSRPNSLLQSLHKCHSILNELEIQSGEKETNKNKWCEKEMNKMDDSYIFELKDTNELKLRLKDTNKVIMGNSDVYSLANDMSFPHSQSLIEMQDVNVETYSPCPFPINLSNSFPKINEETFIGSGENSADELSSAECDY